MIYSINPEKSIHAGIRPLSRHSRIVHPVDVVDTTLTELRKFALKKLWAYVVWQNVYPEEMID
jgi:hypothetical protein